jgi:hypothetical protein
MFQHVSELHVGVQTQSGFVFYSFDSCHGCDIGDVIHVFLSWEIRKELSIRSAIVKHFEIASCVNFAVQPPRKANRASLKFVGADADGARNRGIFWLIFDSLSIVRIRAVVGIDSSERHFSEGQFGLDKPARRAQLDLNEYRFAPDFLEGLRKRAESAKKPFHSVPGRGKAILQIQHSFQKERSNLADESKIDHCL